MKVPQNIQILYALCNSSKQMENMIKLVFDLLLVSIILLIILIKSADSYYIGKIPTCTIIILCLYKYQHKENLIEDKGFIDCCK